MEKLIIFVFTVIFIFLAPCCDNAQNKIISGKSLSGDTDTMSINTTIRHAFVLIRKNPDHALELLNNARRASISSNYTEGIGRSIDYMGMAWFFKYNYDSAISYHKRAFFVFERIDNKKGMALALLHLSYDYSLLHELEKSLECAEKARKLYSGEYNFIGEYNCIEALIYLNRQMQNDRALDSLVKSIVVAAERTGDEKKIANSYYNLGSHFINQAYLNMAIDAFYKSLRIAEKSKDSTGIANALGSIALANLYMQEYEQSINYYNKQKIILKDQNNEYELAITYSNMAMAYSGLGDHETSLFYHFSSLKLLNNMKYGLALSNSLYNIGYTYLLMNNIDSSLHFTQQAFDLAEQNNYYEIRSKCYLTFGKIEMHNHNMSRSLALLEKSVEYAEKYNYPDILLEASDMLSGLYGSQHDYQRAFHYIRLNNKINDSIVSEKNVKRITQLEMQHAFEKKQNDIEVKHVQEKLIYETKLKRDRIVLIFSFIVGSLIVILGIILYRYFLKTRKANKEKEYLLKEIHHRVKNNLMVISSLLNLQSGSITDATTKTAVKESQNRVKSMALIHQLLYQSETFTNIDFPEYLSQLMESLQSTYHKPGSNIRYQIDADNITLDIDTAIPLGLITNEIATNAYKYAFIDCTPGLINIEFKHLKGHACLLRISDNGVGLPLNFNPDDSNTLGLKLVKLLSKQIKAKMDFKSNNGADFQLTFNEQIV